MRPNCAPIFPRCPATRFTREAHFRDHLKQNLHRIEPGLRLYRTLHRDGAEFPAHRGRIDLLAVDRQNHFLVIELKRARARSKTLGQLLYYMAWVDANLGPCRGLIIAAEISHDLQTAAARLPGVSLAQYAVDFSIDPIILHPPPPT